MSKYGKYIIAALIAIILMVTAWGLVFSRDDAKKTKINYPETKIEEINIDARLNKAEYKSNEQAVLDIEITSNKTYKNVMIEVEGMEDRFGENYFKEKKLVNLSEDQPAKITIEKKLPVCSTCSGFSEGDYDINILVLNGAYTLEKQKISFELKS